MKRIIISCFLAGCLEMYDFTIFGFLAETLKYQYLNFLPEKSSSVIIYLLFSVGFIFRPLGSCIFGYIGDKYGRKKSFILSIFVMSISCLGIAILPSYSSIGIVSCYMLVLLRILQGISVGGEYSGCIILAIEHSRKENRGLIGSIVTSGFMSGILLAALISYLLTTKSLPEYCWRFAFLLGFLLSLMGFFIRKQIHETPLFQALQSNITKVNFWQTMKHSWPKCFASIFIVATSGVNFYFTSIYLPNYLKKTTQINFSWLSLLATTLMAILIPLFGFISDKVGRKKLMYLGCLTLVVYSMNLNLIMILNPYYIAILAIIHIIIIAIFTGPMNSFIVEIFPIEVRYSCSAISFSLGMALGGTIPMVAEILRYSQYSNWYFSLYFTTLSLLGFWGLKFATLSSKPLSSN